MVDPDIELILAAYDAFARGDIDAATQNLAPAVEWVEPAEFPNGGRYTGREAVAEYLRTSRAAWLTLSSEPEPRRHGRKIVVLHRVSGTLVDGTRHENSVADVFTVQNGLVTQMTAYADPASVPVE